MIHLTSETLVRAVAVLAIAGASFTAGMAQGAVSDSVAHMNQAVDFLTKARALLDATAVRKGYADVESAKKNVDKALIDINKAVAANAG